MAVSLLVDVKITATESSTLDLAFASAVHRGEFPGSLRVGEYTSGTTDNTQDRIWSDTRSAAAAADTIDLAGSLSPAIGSGTITMVEVRGIFIRNKATTATHSLLLGAGSNPAFAGLFGATGDIVKVPASGCLLWTAPLDGGGLTVTAGTGDILTIDPGANTVAYDIIIWGASA